MALPWQRGTGWGTGQGLSSPTDGFSAGGGCSLCEQQPPFPWGKSLVDPQIPNAALPALDPSGHPLAPGRGAERLAWPGWLLVGAGGAGKAATPGQIVWGRLRALLRWRHG